MNHTVICPGLQEIMDTGNYNDKDMQKCNLLLYVNPKVTEAMIKVSDNML